MNRGPVLGSRTGLVVVLALLASASLVGSSDAATSGVVPGSDPQAQALLQRAVAAENGTVYQGVEYLLVAGDGDSDDPAHGAAGTAGSTSEVLNVTHLPGQGTVVRLILSSSRGQMPRVLRETVIGSGFAERTSTSGSSRLHRRSVRMAGLNLFLAVRSVLFHQLVIDTENE